MTLAIGTAPLDSSPWRVRVRSAGETVADFFDERLDVQADEGPR